jgi:hypothetical protein
LLQIGAGSFIERVTEMSAKRTRAVVAIWREAA